LLAISSGVSIAETSIDIVHPTNRFEEQIGGIAKLATPTLNWYYNKANQPAELNAYNVPQSISNQINTWEKVCNINFKYAGATETGLVAADGKTVVGWELNPVNPNSAAYVRVMWNQQTGEITSNDTHIVITQQTKTITNLLPILNHEFGHAIGLDHTSRVDSIMKNDPYYPAYMMTKPMAFDIEECVRIYGPRVENFSVVPSVTTPKTLKANIVPTTSDIGVEQRIYIVAVYNGMILVKNASGNWVTWSERLDVHTSKIVMSSANSITVVDGVDFSSIAGAVVYVGYGTSQSEMLSSGRYSVLYRF
jgi:hypothetical protein